MKALKLVLLALMVGCSPVTLGADDDEIDYLELAVVLVRDGNYDRGLDALSRVDAAAEDTDVIQYHTVYGLIYLNQNQLQKAIESFDQAVAAGQTEPVIHLYLAQSHFGLENYEAAIVELNKAGEAADRLPSAHLMRAHAHWLLGERESTWQVLADASRRFPARTVFLRREVFYLIELGLFQQAGERGRLYLSKSEGTEDDYVSIGNALRLGGEFAEALRFLEAAHLKFPASTRVSKVLAQTYLDMGSDLSAGGLLYEASLIDPSLVGEAAEVFRRAGKLHRALMLNARITDQAVKLKQRLAILLEMDEHDKVVAMVPAMQRAGVIEAEDVAYALAFAYFKLGEFDQSEAYLSRLTRPDLFNKSIELRRAMDDCAQERWKCG